MGIPSGMEHKKVIRMNKMRSEFEKEYPLPENAAFNGDVYVAPLPAEGMTAYNVRWGAWKAAWQAARTVPEGFVMVPVEILQLIHCDVENSADWLSSATSALRNLLSAAPEPKP